MLKKNVVANYIGQVWSIAINIIFIPVYVKYLGIEAYGLIGIFALLQAWLVIFDMGMTPTISREMAKFSGGGHDDISILNLLRTVEFVSIVVALIIFISIYINSEWLASVWLNIETLDVGTVTNSFVAMGIVVALKFPESIFRSSLIGLQKQVLYNIVNSSMATLRSLGAVLLLIGFDIGILGFFVWQGIVSVITLSVLIYYTYQVLPKTSQKARFSLASIHTVKKFASGIFGITLLSLLLTQTDKILLTNLLTLSEYGYYTIAAVVAGAVYLMAGPVTQAWYPVLTELHTKNQITEFSRFFHNGAQLVTVLLGTASLVLIFFSELILDLWTGDQDIVTGANSILKILVIGNLINGMMLMPYQAQLAHGWTELALKINLISVVIFLPGIYLAIIQYGAIGAASIWVMLNLGYMFIGVHFMFKKILITEKILWYVNDIFIPLLMGFVAALILKTVIPGPSGKILQLCFLAVVSIIIFVCTAYGASYTRDKIKYELNRVFF